MKFDVSRTPGHLVGLAARGFVRLSEARLRPLGFGLGYVPILTAVHEGRASTQTDLARFARIEQPSMAQMLARMERDGLVRRERSDDDRRSSRITLTSLARRRLPHAVAELLRGNREALAGFTADESAAFLGMLERLIANLDSLGGDA